MLQRVAALGEARAGGGERTVGDDVGARHEPAVVRGQPRRDAGDVGRLAAVGPRLEVLAPFVGGLGIASVHQIGVHRAGADGVDSDPVRRQLDGGRLREVDHRRLGRRVGLRAASPAQPGDRGGVDDRAAVALGDHRRGPRA